MKDICGDFGFIINLGMLHCITLLDGGGHFTMFAQQYKGGVADPGSGSVYKATSGLPVGSSEWTCP